MFEKTVTDLINKYHALVKRWWSFTINTPVIDVEKLSNSNAVGAGLWGQPVSRAVYGIMRMRTGSYSAALALVITNGAWYGATVTIAVSSNIATAAKSGTLRYSSRVGGHSDFGGFPGTQTITLPPGGVCEISSENHDASMAGVEAIYTATVTVTPIAGGETPPQFLVFPSAGGTFSITVRGIVPRSLDMINGAPA
jgi:hypothetical protein